MENINQSAVDNFILSVDTQQPLAIHILNLELDTNKYKWNSITRLEILRRLFKMFGKIEAIHA